MDPLIKNILSIKTGKKWKAEVTIYNQYNYKKQKESMDKLLKINRKLNKVAQYKTNI